MTGQQAHSIGVPNSGDNGCAAFTVNSLSWREEKPVRFGVEEKEAVTEAASIAFLFDDDCKPFVQRRQNHPAIGNVCKSSRALN